MGRVARRRRTGPAHSERLRDLRQPPEAGTQRSAPGTLRSSKAGAAVHWSDGFQIEPGPGVGGGASASGRGWGPGPRLPSCPDWAGTVALSRGLSSAPRLGLGVSTSPSPLFDACPSPSGDPLTAWSRGQALHTYTRGAVPLVPWISGLPVLGPILFLVPSNVSIFDSCFNFPSVKCDKIVSSDIWHSVYLF